jgi:NitT/TauT family transport system ATP-binding protein
MPSSDREIGSEVAPAPGRCTFASRPRRATHSPNGPCKATALPQRITTVVATARPVRSARVTSAGIRIDGVAKSFGSLDALAPVDLHVVPGEIVTLLGPSGCGKTTLLRLIAGLATPTAGAITVDGDLPGVARAAKHFGFVPQSPALLPWRTVEANVRVLQDVNRNANPAVLPDPVALLDAVGLGGFREAAPHELSGGMQQRVALARAFALGAPYLLMDEPFAALDEITRADMRHLLAELCEPRNTTVVFVTHSIAEAVFLSDRVAVLSQRPGRIVGVVDVALPRPRVAELEDDSAFFAIETHLRRLLHDGAGR